MLRVAIIGCGFMGRMHANVYGLLEKASLVGVVDQDAAKGKAFGDEFGVPAFTTLEELFASTELDAVDVCLPTYLHREYSVKAMDAGKHVVCEKPMALNAEDAEAMIAASERNNVRLMIAHCIRFWPEYRVLKELIDGGELGKLLSLHMARFGEFPHWSWDNWLGDEARSGGGALDMHIHDTDYALFALGQPTEVFSRGTRDHRGVSHVFTTLSFESGAVAHLQGGWNLPAGAPFKMKFRAVFENGAALFEDGPLTIYQSGKDPVVPEFPKMEAAGGGNISDLGGYYHELNYFVNCLESGAPFEITTPQSSLASLKVTLEEITQVK